MGKFGGLLNKPEMNETEESASLVVTQPETHSQSREQPPPRRKQAEKTAPRQTRKMGRPAGKRSDPQTIQVTAYIQESTHIQAKMKLLTEREKTGARLDFSGLIQKLVSDWIAS